MVFSNQVQHHDGITGTESPKVADMYMQHLTQAMMGVEELLAALILLPHNLDIASLLGSRYHRRGTVFTHISYFHYLHIFRPLFEFNPSPPHARCSRSGATCHRL